MKISIIGAGRVGQAIGRLAAAAGHEVCDVVCRSRRSAVAAARFVGAGKPQDQASARLMPADLILISTPDDRIPEALDIISRSRPRDHRSSQRGASAKRAAVALHTSGALSSDVLAPLRPLGLSTGSCHPLQTFESPARAAALVSRSYFCVEGDVRALRAARRLVRDIGGHVFEIPTEMKAFYHAGAVLASGGLVGLISVSLEILADCGLSHKNALRVLMPLVEGTVANLRAVGPARALTGPVRRGDAGTVKRNLEALSKLDPNWVDLYRMLAERGAQLAEQSGLNRKSIASLRDILKSSVVAVVGTKRSG